MRPAAQLLGALVTGKLPPLAARPAFPPQPAAQIPAAQIPARRPATPAVDPGDAQAVHDALVGQGYRYKPDPFGRIGP